MDKTNQNIAYFIAFAIEQYKNDKHLTGAEAMAIFSRYGVLDYLNEHWEVLHSQSRQWLMEDIDEFITIRQKTE